MSKGCRLSGRAGQLLTQMIENTAAKEGIDIKRQDVYICNVVKCRPAGEPHTAAGRDGNLRTVFVPPIETIKPKAICVLGATAMKALLNNKEGITKRAANGINGTASGDGDLSSVVSAAAVQSAGQARGLGRPKTLLHFVYD